MDKFPIEFGRNISPLVNIETILDILPEWKTKVTSAKIVPGEVSLLRLQFIIAASTKEEIETWVEKFQDKTKTTYSIRTTNKCNGTKVLFKRHFYCHHNPKHKDLYQRRTKNTRCPSTLSITLRSVTKRQQGREPVDAKMPCYITLIATHNHETALNFRKVGDEAKNKLLDLFKWGHSPATALESLKTNILLNTCNNGITLSDRKFCPDYSFCHRLYAKVFKKDKSILDYHMDEKKVLINRIQEFNMKHGETNADILLYESNYCVCIYLSLFKRIHEHIKEASEIVFVDLIDLGDHKRNKLIIFFTQTECGDLPLGVLVLSAEQTDLLIIGLQHLHNKIGDKIFGGNPEGPGVFFISNSPSLQTALKAVWNKSLCFVSTFHILQSVWHGITKPRNDIPDDKQYDFFINFKAMVYAKTEQECKEKYQIAKAEAQNFPFYLKCIEEHWENKTLWATCFRNALTPSDDNFLKVGAQVFREKLFEKLRRFNILQSVDFILTNFQLHYKLNLLDAIQNRLRQNIWNRSITLPTPDVVQEIQIISDCLVLVPIDTNEAMYYIINTDVLKCTCLQKSICKHIEWACFALVSKQEIVATNDLNYSKLFYFVATGNKPSPEWLLSNYFSKNSLVVNDSVIFVIENDEKQEIANEEVIKNQVEIETINGIINDSSEVITNVVEPAEILRKNKSSSNRILKDVKVNLEGNQIKDKPNIIIEPDEIMEEIQNINNDQIKHDNFNDNVPLSLNEILYSGETVIDEMVLEFNSFLEKAPEKVLASLYPMNKMIKNCNDINKFISACDAFTKELQAGGSKRTAISTETGKRLKR